jgi:hypothetical protein
LGENWICILPASCCVVSELDLLSH